MARTVAVLLLALGILTIAAACNDDSDFLLDEDQSEATGTPAFEQRTPQPSPEPSPVGSPLAENATPVPAFQVEVAQTVNRRSAATTEGGRDNVVGSLVPGEKATVVANVPGEAVEADNDIWYQLEDGSFVYSGAVTEIEEAEE